MQPLGIGLDWVTKADIDGHGLEPPAGQLAVDLVTHGSALADFIKAIGLRWIANTKKPPRSAACALRKSAFAASWSSLRPRSTSLVVLVPGPSRSPAPELL
jgi:hypothetical protein